MSICGDVGSGVHALIKELAIRRVEHKSGTHSNMSQYLAKGTEVARLRRRFSFVLQRVLSFRTLHYLCRQGVALVSTRQLRSLGPVPVHARRTGGVTGSEGREGANGVGGGIGVGGGNGDVNGVGGGNRDGAGTGTGAGTGVEVNEGAQDGDGERSEDGAGTGTGVETRKRTQDGNGGEKGDGNENSSEDGNRDENGNEDRIGEGGREAKKRKNPHKSCRRHVEKGRNLGGKRGKCRK